MKKHGAFWMHLYPLLLFAIIVLSLLFLHRLEGVREGTVAAAILVGMVAKQVNRPMQRFSRRFLEC